MNSVDEEANSWDSLVCSIFALYTLLFLYFPGVLFSPVVPAAALLLLYLLRLGASQDSDNDGGTQSEWEPDLSSNPLEIQGFHYRTEIRPGDDGSGPDPFLEWDVRAPLEIIYEEYYEGEDADDQENDSVSVMMRRELEMDVIRRYASLSMFYPESDGYSSSEEGDFGGWEWSPESESRRRDEDDDKEGLIEIALYEKYYGSDGDEEENLIEIDLSPASELDFRRPNRYSL